MDTLTASGPYVRLVRGQSARREIDLSALPPVTALTLGSSPRARWQIAGRGVAPIHLEVFWDGKLAWIGPGLGKDSAPYVDGRELDRWRKVKGCVRVACGEAVLEIASDAAEPAELPMCHTLAAFDMRTLDDEPTRVHEPMPVPQPPPAPAAPASTPEVALSTLISMSLELDREGTGRSASPPPAPATIPAPTTYPQAYRAVVLPPPPARKVSLAPLALAAAALAAALAVAVTALS